MSKRTAQKLGTIVSILILAAIMVGVVATHRQQAQVPSAIPNAPRQLGPSNGSAPVFNQVGDPLEVNSDALVVGTAAQMDVSPPLRDIVPVELEAPTIIREMGLPGETEAFGQAEVVAEDGDAVLQADFGAAEAPSPSVNFEGVNNVAGVYPPDTNGEVGPNHYVQTVNLHFKIWNKSGVSLYGPAAVNTIWSGFGGSCQTRNDGDPVVLYDQLADRWVITQFTASNPYGECVAVSTTGDPTGSYYRYFFQFSTTQFYDYPKLGVWPDGYYLSANRFTTSFVGASAIALERDKMLLGQAARFVEFKPSGAASLLPTDLDGATLPPAGRPNFFMDISGTSLRLWKFHVDWITTANSTLTGPSSMTVASYNSLCSGTRNCVPQPVTSQKLDAIADRLMFRLAYRNFGTHESLVVNHSVDADSTTAIRAAVRWYEVRNPNGTPSLYQQGTYSPDATHRWMGSVAMDRLGNMAMVYSASSTSVYPSIRYTGRLAADALGQMPQGETTLIAGSGYQSGTGARWGDYSDITVDPVDDCTFWFTTEYIQTSGTAPWQTRIGAFKFPSCGGAVPTPTNTPVPTATNTPGPTATNTPVPTATNTPLPTATNTPLPTATNSPTPGACPNQAGGYCRTDNEARAWTTGTTNQSITGDDATKTVTLPFSFKFAGTTYTSLKISSNGNVHFGTASSAYTNVAIPNAGAPNAMIAALWDDLNPAAGGAIYTITAGSAPNRIFVIEWRDVRRYNAGTSGATFQIQLQEGSNHIWVLYQDTIFGSSTYDSGLSATSGVENAAGSAGNAYSYNTAVLTNNKVLHFWPAP